MSFDMFDEPLMHIDGQAYYPLCLATLSARFSFAVLAGFFFVAFFCVIPLAIASLLYLCG